MTSGNVFSNQPKEVAVTAFLIAAGFAKASATIGLAALLIAGGGLIAAKDMVWKR